MVSLCGGRRLAFAPEAGPVVRGHRAAVHGPGDGRLWRAVDAARQAQQTSLQERLGDGRLHQYGTR